jgi:hypothetical protein
MSDNAADKSLRFFEFRFAGYAQGALFLVLFVALMQLGLSPLAYAALGTSAIIAIACFLTGLHYGKEAGLDIARSNGLPDRSWRRAVAKTPAEFDKWLAKEKIENSNPGRQ